MPKKLLNKIIRHLDADDLESFSLDKQSGELCYLAKTQKKTIKIPNALCEDFFASVEKALSTNQNGEKRFRLFDSRGKIGISLKYYHEDGQRKISAEINKPEKLITFKHLGFSLEQQKKVRQALRQKKGLIVAGLPAGNGLSNLIYSLADEINLEEKDAYLLSASQEHRIQGLNFIPLDYPSEEDLRKKLAWLEKKDAEVIIVPEIYERQTALELVRMANAGHLVIAGCRSRDAFSVLNSFLKSGPVKEVLTNFSLIISGRQVHRLCPHCIEKYQSSQEEINIFAKRFSWSKKTAEKMMPKKLLRSIGCPKCHYHGHLDKTGIYEILTLDQELKNCEDILTLRRLALEKGHYPLLAVALNAAQNGIISLREILSLKF